MAKIAVIGSGLIGRAWAISFARAGNNVSLYDQGAGAAEKAVAFAHEMAAPLEAEDLLEGQSADEVVARIRPAASLRDAVDGAIHVQENTPEDLATNRRVFAELDAIAASNRRLRDESVAGCAPRGGLPPGG